MTISSLSAANLGGMVPAGLFPELKRISQLTQAPLPSLPDPSVIVTLGTGTPAPLTYNAAGRLAALPQAVSSAAPGQDVPATDLNTRAMGLDSSTLTAGIIDAIGILQNSPSDTTAKALSSLLTANLGLTESALNTAVANASVLDSTGLLRNSASGSTSMAQTFASLLVAEANLATARLNANAATSGDIIGTGDLQTALVNSTSQALTSLAVADVNLAAAAAGTSTATATSVAVASALGQIQNFPGESAGQAASLLPTTGLNAAATGLETTGTAAAVINSQSTPTVITSQAVSSPPTTSAIPAATAASSPATAADFFNASGALQSLLADATAQALTTVATDPSYGAAAAALYASVGVFNFRLNESQTLLPRVSSPVPLPVLPIRSITQLAAV